MQYQVLHTQVNMESCSYLLSWDLLLATVLALQGKLLADFIMGLKHTVKDDVTLCPFMETQQAAALLQIIFVSHLDVFKVEGHFAVFAVERSRLTFSLIVSILLSAKDRGLAGLTLDPLKLTAALMLSLNMEDRPVVMATFFNVLSHAALMCLFTVYQQCHRRPIFYFINLHTSTVQKQ